jgi:hypothetical protein
MLTSVDAILLNFRSNHHAELSTIVKKKNCSLIEAIMQKNIAAVENCLNATRLL